MWRDMVVTRFESEKIAEDWAVSELAGALVLKLPRIGVANFTAHSRMNRK
jgi:hypothetical protein